MSNKTPLNAQSVNYILSQTDAGAEPRQILHAFRASGQSRFSIETIERCLKDNGRGIAYYDPNSIAHGYQELKHLPAIPMPERTNPYIGRRAARAASNPYGQQQQQQQPRTNYAVQSFAQAQANVVPGFCWNAQADSFAISAHRLGQTVSQIIDQLRRNGYDKVTVGEVVASLIEQGATDVRWSYRTLQYGH